MSEPPSIKYVNPYLNMRVRGPKWYLPPDPAWPLACHVVPPVPAKLNNVRSNKDANVEAARRSGTPSQLSSRTAPSVTIAPYLGWRLFDAFVTAEALARALNATVPPAHEPFPPINSPEALLLVQEAAREDGVKIDERFEHERKPIAADQNSLKKKATWYGPLLTARHRALADAWRAGGGSGAAKAVSYLMEQCIDHHALGLNATLLHTISMEHEPLAIAAVGGISRYHRANVNTSRSAGWLFKHGHLLHY